jgi:hypothetical protein
VRVTTSSGPQADPVFLHPDLCLMIVGGVVVVVAVEVGVVQAVLI